MSAPSTTAPILGKRKLIMMFAPLAILASAAIVANLGGVAKPAKAAAINVTATVNPAAWTDSNGCANTITLNLNDGAPTDVDYGTCVVTFGITNNTSNLHIGFDNNFWDTGSFYSVNAVAACSGALAQREIGIKVNTGGTATPAGAAGCATGEATGLNGATAKWRTFTRGGSIQVCTSPTVGTKTCPLEFGARGPATGVIPSAVYSGTMTPTAT